MKKKKARFKSLSTPGKRQDASNYLVELIFLRTNHGAPLPPSFWQQTRYKFRYRREIQAVRKFIKKYGEVDVLFVAISNYITTWTNYANIEAMLQRREERKKLKASAKDLTPVQKPESPHGPDLRAENNMCSPPVKKSLFERLKELKDG